MAPGSRPHPGDHPQADRNCRNQWPRDRGRLPRPLPRGQPPVPQLHRQLPPEHPQGAAVFSLVQVCFIKGDQIGRNFAIWATF
jgi:hypothetical protein